MKIRIFRSLNEEIEFLNAIDELKRDLLCPANDQFAIEEEIKDMERQWEMAWRVYQGGKAA